jgi:hypothetical protein
MSEQSDSRAVGSEPITRRIIMWNRIMCFVLVLGVISFSLLSCDNIFTSQVDAGRLLPSLPEVSSLAAYPARWEYTENDSFFERTELKVWAAYADGTTREISIEKVELELKDNTSIKEPVWTSIGETVKLRLGKNDIRVSYAQKETTFTLIVWSGDGPGSGSDDDDETTGGNSGTTIEIDVGWKE